MILPFKTGQSFTATTMNLSYNPAGLNKKRSAKKQQPMWVKRKDLLRISKMKEGLLDYYISVNKDKSDCWVKRKGSGGVEIDVNTIPNRERYGIPNNELLQLHLERIRCNDQEPATNARENWLMGELLQAEKDFPIYRNEIKSRYAGIKDEKATEYARHAAVALWIKKHCLNALMRGDMELLYQCWANVYPDRYKSYKSFNAFVNTCKASEDLLEVCVKATSVNTKKGVCYARPQWVMDALQTAYIQNRKLLPAEAHVRLQKIATELGEPCPSVGTVKTIFREFDSNLYMYEQRNGKKYALKQLPYASFELPQTKNALWQCDGKNIGFLVQRPGMPGGEQWLVFLVMDIGTRKYVGYAIGRNENTELILAALENAVRHTKHWPHELVTDKAAITQTKIWNSKILPWAEKQGCKVEASINPQAKSVIERNNKRIDALFKDYDGYLGTSPMGRKPVTPKPEAMREIYKPKNYKTEDEIKAIMEGAIMRYNDTPQELLGNKTPNECEQEMECKYGVPVDEALIASLFKEGGLRKVDRGQINIMVGGKKHEFQLRASDIALWNNKQVYVCYDDLKDGIYLYEPDETTYISFVPPKTLIPAAAAERTEAHNTELHKQVAKKKKLLNDGAKQVEQSKATLMANPDLVDAIDAHMMPKNLRKEIEDNRHLKRQIEIAGIDTRNMPYRPAHTVRELAGSSYEAQRAASQVKITDADRAEMEAELNG